MNVPAMLHHLRRPEYVFRPRQLLRRLRRPWGFHLNPREQVTLPWLWPIRIRTHETIGRLIWTFGVFDLPVTEALWRLTEPGDTAVDVGANIGCMTCVLAFRTGPTGRVVAFEPFPEVFAELQENLALWRSRGEAGHVELRPVALGARRERGRLDVPDATALNRGLASVSPGAVNGAGPMVEIDTLERAMESVSRIDVLKIDVEGGELAVLQGAERLLREKRIRDVVFEDHGDHPTPATRYLEGLGYAMFTLRSRLGGLVVRPAGEPTLPLDGIESPSFIATTDPARVNARLHGGGWKSLRRPR